MRLLLDMGAAPRTAAYLREQGHDAVHLRDEGLKRLPDEEIVKKATQEDRILVTFDLDFSRIIALQRASSPSMIVFRLEEFTTDWINTRLMQILKDQGQALAQGAIVVVEVDRIRVRNLPIW